MYFFGKVESACKGSKSRSLATPGMCG